MKLMYSCVPMVSGAPKVLSRPSPIMEISTHLKSAEMMLYASLRSKENITCQGRMINTVISIALSVSIARAVSITHVLGGIDVIKRDSVTPCLAPMVNIVGRKDKPSVICAQSAVSA